MTKHEIDILAHRAAAQVVTNAARNAAVDGLTPEDIERYEKALQRIASGLWREAFRLERQSKRGGPGHPVARRPTAVDVFERGRR